MKPCLCQHCLHSGHLLQYFAARRNLWLRDRLLADKSAGWLRCGDLFLSPCGRWSCSIHGPTVNALQTGSLAKHRSMLACSRAGLGVAQPEEYGGTFP
ncbi:MAG: hypothetical protein SGPRY_001900 [Prymnesium sp.]